MARYEHLPVFQRCYDLVIEIHKRVENFPRAHRYSIGEKIKNLSFALLDAVIKANSDQEKSLILSEAILRLESLKIYVRLCYDLKIIGTGGFAFLVKIMAEIGRQIGGWQEWSLKIRTK